MEDLEEDPEMRQHINIYKDSSKLVPVDTDELSDPNCSQITLEEMLDDLTFDDIEVSRFL